MGSNSRSPHPTHRLRDSENPHTPGPGVDRSDDQAPLAANSATSSRTAKLQAPPPSHSIAIPNGTTSPAPATDVTPTESENSWWDSLGDPAAVTDTPHDRTRAAPVKRLPPRWYERVFESGPSRDITGRSRYTHRKSYNASTKRESREHVESGHEMTAAFYLQHLWRVGIVARFKPQPFCLADLGYPTAAVPDLLVQLSTGQYLCIEVKTKHYLTVDIQAKLDDQQRFLAERGLEQLLWTNEDRLCKGSWHAVRHLDRGMKLPLDVELESKIQKHLVEGMTFGALCATLDVSFEVGAAAAARGLFLFNLEENLDDNTTLYPAGARWLFSSVFARRDAPRDWFEALAAPKAPQRPRRSGRDLHPALPRND